MIESSEIPAQKFWKLKWEEYSSETIFIMNSDIWGIYVLIRHTPIRIIDPYGIGLRNFCNFQSAERLQFFSELLLPARSVLQHIAALLVDPVNQGDGMCQGRFYTFKELLKRLRQKRTAQKQHGIVIVIQPERIPDHHVHPIVFLRPLLRCPAGDLVDFDTAQPAGRMAFQQISKNAPLPASDIQKNILLSQCDKSVTPLFYPCVLLLRTLMNTGDFYIHIIQTYFDNLFNRWRRIPVM